MFTYLEFNRPCHLLFSTFQGLNYLDNWEKAAAKHVFRQKYNGRRGRGRFYADRQKYNIYLRKKYNV